MRGRKHRCLDWVNIIMQKVKYNGVTSIITVINNITGMTYIMYGVYNFDQTHSRWALKSFFLYSSWMETTI